MGQSSSTPEKQRPAPPPQYNRAVGAASPDMPPPSYKPTPVVPRLLEADHRIISDALAANIYETLPPAYRAYGKSAQWFQVYNSNKNGKSFHRLVQAITEKGPTVIVISIANSSRVIGAFCDSDWLTIAARDKQSVSLAAARQRASREGQNPNNLSAKPQNQNNIFFGAEPCFLFRAGGEGDTRIADSGEIYRSHSFANSNFMYLFNAHPQDDNIGIGMGGQPGYFCWFIDRWLEQGTCKGAKGTTFQNPRLSQTEDWAVGAVEAYAVKPEIVQLLIANGGTDARGPQSVLQANPDNNADKLLLELHGTHDFNAHQRPDLD